MFIALTRNWKYILSILVVFLVFTYPVVHAWMGDRPPLGPTNQSSGWNREPSTRLMEGSKNMQRAENNDTSLIHGSERNTHFIAPQLGSNKESLGNNLLNGSCISPTYGSNNFLPTSPQKPSKISEVPPSSMSKNHRKKPPRMRRENPENRPDIKPWRMFR